MQLQLSFSVLLSTLLIVLSATNDAAARPFKREPEGGMVTLPLKRINQRSDIHPQMLLQQHINRGHRRLARMAGREEPSSLRLRDNLNKRMFILESGPGSRIGRIHSKRFNRQGAKRPATSAQEDLRGNEDNAKDHFNQDHKVHSQGSQGVSGQSAAGADLDPNAAPAPSLTPGGIASIDVTDANNGGLTAASSPTAANSLGLNIEANDVGYIATVQIGTPPTDYLILMDSGSADFWVGSENCQSEAGGGCGNHTFLGSASSSTFVDLGQQFSVEYGSGSVSGDIVLDNVVLAGLSLNNHTFGVANTESTDFSDDSIPFDGLMGLAQSALSEQGVPTPIESLADQGTLSAAITSFKLGRVADGTNDGEVTFGGLDSTKFDANTLVTFNNVNTEGFWEGAMDDVAVNGQSLGLQGRTAILDTGTTLIIAPPDDAEAVHSAIPGAQSDGQGGFTIPCTQSANVTLSFGGSAFSIDPRDLLFSPVDPNDLTGDCVSGISAGEVGGNTEWLVGDVFLKNVYFSVNVGQNAISLAVPT